MFKPKKIRMEIQLYFIIMFVFNAQFAKAFAVRDQIQVGHSKIAWEMDEGQKRPKRAWHTFRFLRFVGL